MELFSVTNRCPKCGGDASTKYHRPGLNCRHMPGPHIHRKCEDCGFSWGEKTAKKLSGSSGQLPLHDD
jgi:hypothetical protein